MLYKVLPDMMRILLVFFAVIFSVNAYGQAMLTGRVTDSQGNPVPFTSVYISGAPQGTTANQNGYYIIRLKPGKYSINYQNVGFKKQTEDVELNSGNNLHNVQLIYEDYQQKQDVTGSEDPADQIIRNAIGKRAHYLNEVNGYSCDVYLRGAQKLISAPKGILTRGVARELQLNIKTGSILYMLESQSRFNFEQPNRYKEVTQSSKVTGGYNAFNFNRAADLQVNFYKNMFNIEGLNPRGFISPIADDAFRYYTYKLLGTTTENGLNIDKIQVTPKDDREPVFKGNIYIIEDQWRIYAAHLFVTGKSNLNFVDTLNVNQVYVPVTNQVWRPASVALIYSGDVLGFRYQGYILGTFSNYELNPAFPPHYFNGETVVETSAGAKRDSVYWRKNRPVPLSGDEQQTYHIKDSIFVRHDTEAYKDSAEVLSNKFSLLNYVFFGDTIKHRHLQETIGFNPLYDALQYNTVEGWVLDFKPTYTKGIDANRSYSISPEVRYGFDARLFSINTGFKYVFDAANQGALYGKVGTGVYNLNNVGSVGTFLNTINSLVFKDNDLKLYRSKDIMVGIQRRVARGLFLDGNLDYAIRNALQNQSNRTIFNYPNTEFTSNNPYIQAPALSAPLLFVQSDALTLKLSGTYTFDEDYTTMPGGSRIYNQSKYPKVKVTYRKGINNLFGSDVNYDYGDVQIFHDHINFGIYGYSAFLVTAGGFFNNKAVSYPDYKWFQGNQGITFEPGISEFHFLPYYSYSSQSFFEAHYEHNFSGFLLNKVPFIRDLKLEEIVGGNYLTTQSEPNYAELYIGIQRFFFRVDYGFVYRGDGHLDQGIKLYFGL